MRNSRRSARMWLPARPPKMPYSCCKDTMSTLLKFRKSEARQVIAYKGDALDERMVGFFHKISPSRHTPVW
ncbi:MAG: hypothetical protein HZA01_14270 [Nitrospinae bacterium]|nr:hypothetical protein [Nitrospinota bacterium]